MSKGVEVKIRSWESMEREFGLGDDGDIPLPTSNFITAMKYLCGTKVTLVINYGGWEIPSDTDWEIVPEMVEDRYRHLMRGI